MIRHYLTHEEFEEINNMNAANFMCIPYDGKFKEYFNEFICVNTDIREIKTILRISEKKQTISSGDFFFIDFVAENWDGKMQVYEIAAIEEWNNKLQEGYAIEGKWGDDVTFDDFLSITNLSI